MSELLGCVAKQKVLSQWICEQVSVCRHLTGNLLTFYGRFVLRDHLLLGVVELCLILELGKAVPSKR